MRACGRGLRSGQRGLAPLERCEINRWLPGLLHVVISSKLPLEESATSAGQLRGVKIGLEDDRTGLCERLALRRRVRRERRRGALDRVSFWRCDPRFPRDLLLDCRCGREPVPLGEELLLVSLPHAPEDQDEKRKRKREEEVAIHRSLSVHGVVAARVEGVASDQTTQGSPAATYRAVTTDRRDGVVRAARLEATSRAEQGRQQDLIEP